MVLTPPEKYESQIGSSSQLLGKIKFMFQTTNQYSYCGKPMLPVLSAANLEHHHFPHASMAIETVIFI
jgi:hypothetical protein